MRMAITRDVLKKLRGGALYALPESVLPLDRDPEAGNTFVRRTTLWTDVPAGNSGLGTTLSEFTPPTGRDMAADFIDVTVAEVGDFVKISSQAAYQNGEQKSLANAADVVARMEAVLIDNHARAAYAAASADFFAGTASSNATLVAGNVLTTAIVDEMVTQARERDLVPFDDGLYRIVGHPRLFKALLTEAATNGGGFVNQAVNGQVGDLSRGQIGDYHGARFLSGSRGIVTANVDGPALANAGNAAIAATDTVTTSSAHGLVAGNRIKITSLTGGAGLTAGNTYYVVAPVTSTTFKLSATKNGAAIDITSDSSVFVANQVNDVYRALLVGKTAIALADPTSLEHYVEKGGGVSDPLHQTFATVGFRGFYGKSLVSIANDSDGSGNLSADVNRSIQVAAVGTP